MTAGSATADDALRRRELRPVFGVALGVLAEHLRVDGVEFDEAADARRFVRAVEQDAPRRAAAQSAPGQLRGGVADREADRAARDREGFGLVDAQRPRRD